MKKSNYTVTIPFTDFEQFMEYKKKYEELIAELKECYDISRFEIDNTIRFDRIKAIKLSKEYLSLKYKNAIIMK